MKQLTSRVFTKLSIEWKTDGTSSQEVHILHRRAGVGRGEEEIAGRQCHCAQPLILPSLLPKGRGNIASRKWGSGNGFRRNGLRFAILLVGLGVATISRADLLAARGDNTFGQPRLPVGRNNLKAISRGEYHKLARGSDGLVIAWGLNNQGQTDAPPGLANVKAIASAGYRSMVLHQDGTLVTSRISSLPTDNLSAIAVGGVQSDFEVIVPGDGSLQLRELGALLWPRRCYPWLNIKGRTPLLAGTNRGGSGVRPNAH